MLILALKMQFYCNKKILIDNASKESSVIIMLLALDWFTMRNVGPLEGRLGSVALRKAINTDCLSTVFNAIV